MKKALLLILVCFMALAPMVASASVRTEGMGILPQQDEDIDLIWLFPQKIEEYSVVDYRMEYLGATDEWGGIIHKDPYVGNWGLYYGRPFNNADTYSDAEYIGIQGLGILDGSSTWEQLLYNGITTPGGEEYEGGQYDYTVYDPENKVDIFKTFKAGDGVFGIHLNYALWKGTDDWQESGTYTESDANGLEAGEQGMFDQKEKTGVIGIDLGYGLKDLGPFNSLDMAVGYSMGTIDYTYVSEYQNGADTGTYVNHQDEMSGDGINEIRVNLRGVKEASENTNVMVNVNVKMGKLALTDREESAGVNEVIGDVAGEIDEYSSEYKMSKIDLGLSCSHNVNGGSGKVVGGLNFVMAGSSWTHSELYNQANSSVADRIDDADESGEELKASYAGVWANIGVETNLAKWLQFRAGLSKDILSSTKMTLDQPGQLNTTTNAYESMYSTEEVWNNPQDVIMTFGAGVNFKNWNVDLLITKSALEGFLSDGDYGEGVLYSGSVINFVKGQIKYNF